VRLLAVLPDGEPDESDVALRQLDPRRFDAPRMARDLADLEVVPAVVRVFFGSGECFVCSSPFYRTASPIDRTSPNDH